MSVMLVSNVAPAYAAPAAAATLSTPLPSVTRKGAVAPRSVRRNALVGAAGTSLLSEPFSESNSPANAWTAYGSACMTAGTAATPATSIRACGSAAPLDASGQGALQVTGSGGSNRGFAVYKTPLPTADGIAVTFTDYAFNGTSPGANGLALFLSDASQALPTVAGGGGGALGYTPVGSGSSLVRGIANAYVGVGFDEYGAFSSPATDAPGGPGSISETIAVRGAASNGYQYIGGATNTSGKAASLPFPFDQPAVATRPAIAPTINATLSAAGQLTVSIDRNDGNGFVQYYTQAIVGVAGEPAVPAQVYLGFSASTGGKYERHQIANLTVTTLPAPTPTPTPTPVITPTPTPTPVITPTPTPSPTDTPTPTPTPVIMPTPTPSPTDTPTPTPTPVITPTPIITPTPTPTPTITPTPTPTPVITPTPTPSPTDTPTPTPTPIITPTPTPSPTPTITPTPIVTPTPTPTPTITPTPTPTPVITPTPTPSPTDTPTPTPTPIISPTPTPTPSPTPIVTPTPTPAGFNPTAISNLAAWYDASVPANVGVFGSSVATWYDRSGNGNNVAQATSALEPAYVPAGINGLGSISFNAKQYLLGSNGAFSTNLYNESSVFVVTNESTVTQDSDVLFSGAYRADPHWLLRLSENGSSIFDLGSQAAGRIATHSVGTGPALWSAAGSFSGRSQYLRKNGNLLVSGAKPTASSSGNSPLAIGAEVQGSSTGYFYSGLIGEVVIYNRFVAPAESAQIEGYLACKWGLQNRLPANHPYRTTCPQGGTPSPVPTASPKANALLDPQQLRSSNGQLTFNVVASQNQSTGYPQLTYNGSAVPPTLRLLPGDSLVVNLTNNLPAPPANAGYLNDTNLHYHGLHVNPNAPGDDSIDMLAMPGQSLQYRIAIPANHPSGLYWYHSHAHGEAERQTLAGMSGALIIDGITQFAPQVANLPERILIARDAVPGGGPLPAANAAQVNAMRWGMQHTNVKQKMSLGTQTPVSNAAPAHSMNATMHGMGTLQAHSMNTLQAHGTNARAMSMNVPVRGNSTALTRNPFVLVDPKYRRFASARLLASTHCSGTETAAHVWTLNGQTSPSIGIRPGEQQFWRLANAGSDTYLDVQVDNTQMQIVAIDGVPLASVGNAPLTVSHYVLAPASRIEFIVTGPPSGTAAYLRTNCFDAGSAGLAMPAATLATIDANSSLTDLAHRRLLDRTSASSKLRPGAKAGLTVGRRSTSASSIKTQPVSGPAQTITYSDQNTINGEAYNPSGPPLFYAQSGTSPLWTIVNYSSQVHTFHIHQIHFLMQSVTGGTASDQVNVGQVLDNVNVPAANANGPGSVTLKMDFSDPSIIGTFLLHCHILSHEDGGMMASVRVGTAPPITVSKTQVNFATPTSPAQTVTAAGGTGPYGVTGCTGVANATVAGNTVTITPASSVTTSSSCEITLNDQNGLVAGIYVTVTAAPPAITVSPNVLGFASPNAAAQNASVGGGTPPYTVSGCAGIATETVNSGNTGITVTPHGAGSCTLTVSDSGASSATVSVQVSGVSNNSPIENLTFHQNVARQGWYEAESTLNATNVASASFGLRARLAAPSGMPAFGKVYAQPLFVSNETVADGSLHNLVIVATATDQVYAFDDQTLQVVWHRSFTSPPAITQQSWRDSTCQDVNPDVGITGTPVIDRTLDEMFVVVPTDENGVSHLRLHAISLRTGADTLTPTEVSGSVPLAGGGVATTSPVYNFNRGALLEANGNIYVPLGTHCDFSSNVTHGWVLAYTTGLRPAGNIVNTTDGSSTNYLGSPWMAGYGPASDALGNIYFATGNGVYDGVSNFSMSVLKVPGNLDMSKASVFTPYGEAADSKGDQDLGSGGVMLLPDGLSSSFPHLLIQGGKCGVGGSTGTVGCQKYILNRDSMGGRQVNDAGAVWHASTAGEIFGGPAYFEDSIGLSHVVYGGGNASNNNKDAPLNTYTLSFSPISMTVQSSAVIGGLERRDRGSQPIVSSLGRQAGTAVVWALQTPPGGAAGSLTLYAFDALNLSHTLYSGVAGSWTIGAGATTIAGALISPVVANGKVYVPTDGSVAVFGL